MGRLPTYIMPNSKLEADPQKEFCSNPNYGKRGVGNIVRYGHDRNGRQRFKCKTCDGVFVETNGTVFYNRKLSEEQIIMICKLLVENKLFNRFQHFLRTINSHLLFFHQYFRNPVYQFSLCTRCYCDVPCV